MTNTSSEPHWERDALVPLRAITPNDMPGLEMLLLDELASWAASDNNRGRGYDEQHAAVVISALLSAAERPRYFRSSVSPDVPEEITSAREQVVAGIHELASSDNGLQLLVTRLMPAVLGELRRNAGNQRAQVYWLYYYALLALAAGISGDYTEAVMHGIMASFRAWDALATNGFVPPWHNQTAALDHTSRSRHAGSHVSADMVISHVETLIEQLTGTAKAIPDADGDYPIRYRNALYYIRITRGPIPVIQVFSIAVDEADLTDALVHDLNEINAQLHFCRAFWVRGQVLFESEHLGASVTGADFNECALSVAEATDQFARGLAERHEGRLAFEESKEPEYRSAADDNIGMYL